MFIHNDSSKKIRAHQIHKFSRKLLQHSLFNWFKVYLDWRIKLSKGKNAVMPKAHPVSINLDLTTACNYYCDHCIDLGMINNGRRLKFGNIKSLVSHWVEEGLRSVIIIGGGEPILHSDFKKIIAFLKSKEVQIGIATNGSRVAMLLRVANILDERDWIRLSLDAGSNDTFQRIHSPKMSLNLEEILKDIKKMRNEYAQYQLGFSFLVLSGDQVANNRNLVDNIKEIPLAAKKAKEAGFSYFSVKPFISPYPSRFTEIHKKYITQIRKEVELAKKLEDDTFRVVESFNLLALFNNLNEKLKKQPRICHAQFFRWVVTPDGIFNCPTWRGFAKAYLLDTEQNFSKKYCRQMQTKLCERVENFDAAKECAQVSCIYNDFNWFVEKLIRNPDKLNKLQPLGDYGDYFL